VTLPKVEILSDGTYKSINLDGNGVFVSEDLKNSVTSVRLRITPPEKGKVIYDDAEYDAAAGFEVERKNLQTGANSFTIIGKAEAWEPGQVPDDKKKQYTVTIMRKESDNAQLSSLQLDTPSAHTNGFAFNKTSTSPQSLKVDNSVTSILLTPSITDGQTITTTINGVPHTTTPQSLTAGDIVTFTILVTAEDGVAKKNIHNNCGEKEE
jgi:hypothetical protein